jgi:hypothetical protein
MGAAVVVERGIALVAAAILCVLTCCAGGLVVRTLGVRASGLWGAMLRFGLGWGLIGLILTALGFAGLLRAGPIAAVVLGCAAAGAYRDGGALIRLGRDCRRVVLGWGAAHRFWSAAVVVMAGGYLVRALMPPSGFDALMYHLSTVKLYLARGGFYDIFHNPQSDFPMLTEMHYLIGLACGTDLIARLLSLQLALALALATGYVSWRYGGGRRSASAAMAIVLTFSVTIANVPECDVDVAMALWTLLAVLCARRAVQSGRRSWLIAGGVFAGMVAASKIFGVFALLPLVWAGKDRARASGRELARDAVATLAPWALFALPWYIKSAMYTGSILSIGRSTIQGQGLGNPLGMSIESPIAAFVINTVVRVAAAPWTFTLMPGQHQGDTFGPLPLIAASMLLLIRPPRRLRFLLIAAFVFWCEILVMEMWFIPGGSSIRYSLFVLAALAPLIAWVPAGLRENDGRLSAAVHVMIVTVVCMQMMVFVKRYHRDWRAFLTNSDRASYYRAVMPGYEVVEKINRLDTGAVVMPVYNFGNYLLDAPYVTAYRRYASSEALRADLRRLNVSYIFANNVLDTAENAQAFPALVRTEEVAADDGLRLFRIVSFGRPGDAAGRPQSEGL